MVAQNIQRHLERNAKGRFLRGAARSKKRKGEERERWVRTGSKRDGAEEP